MMAQAPLQATRQFPLQITQQIARWTETAWLPALTTLSRTQRLRLSKKLRLTWPLLATPNADTGALSKVASPKTLKALTKASLGTFCHVFH